MAERLSAFRRLPQLNRRPLSPLLASGESAGASSAEEHDGSNACTHAQQETVDVVACSACGHLAEVSAAALRAVRRKPCTALVCAECASAGKPERGTGGDGKSDEVPGMIVGSVETPREDGSHAATAPEAKPAVQRPRAVLFCGQRRLKGVAAGSRRGKVRTLSRQ